MHSRGALSARSTIAGSTVSNSCCTSQCSRHWKDKKIHLSLSIVKWDMCRADCLLRQSVTRSQQSEWLIICKLTYCFVTPQISLFCYSFKNQTSACFCALHFLLIDLSMILTCFCLNRKQNMSYLCISTSQEATSSFLALWKLSTNILEQLIHVINMSFNINPSMFFHFSVQCPGGLELITIAQVWETGDIVARSPACHRANKDRQPYTCKFMHRAN